MVTCSFSTSEKTWRPTEKNGLHYRDGQHDQTMVDWRALLTFAQWHFDGQRPAEPKEFQVPRAERSMP